MKTKAKKVLITKVLYRIGIKAVLALLLTLSALASCMQAEKTSLDTSGAQGLLLGSLSFEGGLFGGGSGGATGPFSKDGNPTVVATSPTNAATIAPCSGSPCRARVRIQFDESMDTSTVLPLLVEISDGSWADSSIAPLTSSISWSGTKYQNDTVTFELDSVHLPEGSNFKFNILTGYLKDLDSVPNDLSAPYSWTATTSFHSGRLPLVDTGSTLCTDVNGNSITCTGTLQDGAISQPRNLTRNANGTVVDNVTGLVWSACPQGTTYVHSDPGGSCTGAATGMTWYAAQAACSARNTEALGGRTDWRLPTADELHTIMDHSVRMPSIDLLTFPGTPASSIFWSATTSPKGPAYAYYANFDEGILLHLQSKGVVGSAPLVRCVAGTGNRSTAGFRDNGDNTITDQRTGLRWTKCSLPSSGSLCVAAPARMNWDVANTACGGLSIGGRQWRMPSKNELQSIWNLQAINPTHSLFNATADKLWTSTTRALFSVGAYPTVFIIDFATTNNGIGTSTGRAPIPDAPFVRCVADE
ncbi:DUF1566 domain-containing protein [Leptonema illini]|uniref:Uncharacterized protein n=1 Tax=Leptonema illini DSM 21528 TaxID=929563 RepID=H2CL41_9LEPT|nr:DUF1566 domain-containing protein [Leptonema illini]EHQ07285.1 protein of unknown function DUF1566 [Leptonema illini DSM 21528]